MTPLDHLPHDVVVEIAGRVAATSPRPMDDIASARASCRAMHAACTEGFVGRRVEPEREAAMKWNERERYRAVVEHLAAAGNPEACSLAGLAIVFAADGQCDAGPAGVQCLARAAEAGHKAAAYVLGVLRYDAGDEEDAVMYIRQVEGKDSTAGSDVDGNAAGNTNTECVRCQAQAEAAVREVTWNVTTLPSPAPVSLPKEGTRCTAAGCGVPQGWSSYAIFCSEACRIRHEHAQFSALVSLPDSDH
ncbi:hypothetical protein EJB05_31654, partial [Eragrostis curvula]